MKWLYLCLDSITVLYHRLFFYYYYWHIYPPITRKQRSAVRARLGVAGHLSTTLRWGNPVKLQRKKLAGFLHTVS